MKQQRQLQKLQQQQAQQQSQAAPNLTKQNASRSAANKSTAQKQTNASKQKVAAHVSANNGESGGLPNVLPPMVNQPPIVVTTPQHLQRVPINAHLANQMDVTMTEPANSFDASNASYEFDLLMEVQELADFMDLHGGAQLDAHLSDVLPDMTNRSQCDSLPASSGSLDSNVQNCLDSNAEQPDGKTVLQSSLSKSTNAWGEFNYEQTIQFSTNYGLGVQQQPHSNQSIERQTLSTDSQQPHQPLSVACEIMDTDQEPNSQQSALLTADNEIANVDSVLTNFEANDQKLNELYEQNSFNDWLNQLNTSSTIVDAIHNVHDSSLIVNSNSDYQQSEVSMSIDTRIHTSMTDATGVCYTANADNLPVGSHQLTNDFDVFTSNPSSTIAFTLADQAVSAASLLDQSQSQFVQQSSVCLSPLTTSSPAATSSSSSSAIENGHSLTCEPDTNHTSTTTITTNTTNASDPHPTGHADPLLNSLDPFAELFFDNEMEAAGKRIVDTSGPNSLGFSNSTNVTNTNAICDFDLPWDRTDFTAYWSWLSI